MSIRVLIAISLDFMQNPILKHPARKTAGKQITKKLQTSISNNQNSINMFVFRDLEHVWDFEFRSL